MRGTRTARITLLGETVAETEAADRSPDSLAVMRPALETLARYGCNVVTEDDYKRATITTQIERASDYSDNDWLEIMNAASIVRRGFEHRGWEVRG